MLLCYFQRRAHVSDSALSHVEVKRLSSVSVCFLRRKLVEQLHLLSQTLERLCPNTRTHTHARSYLPSHCWTANTHTAVSFQLLTREDEANLEARNAQGRTSRQLSGSEGRHVHQRESEEDLQPAGTLRQKSGTLFPRSVTHSVLCTLLGPLTVPSVYFCLLWVC